MQLYYFVLKTGRETIADHEGNELTDDDAARLHAATVAQQLMRHREARTRGWRIQVCDDYLQPKFEVFFAEVDATLKKFPPHLTAPLEQVIRTMAAFNDAILTMQDTLADVRKTLAFATRILTSISPSRTK